MSVRGRKPHKRNVMSAQNVCKDKTPTATLCNVTFAISSMRSLGDVIDNSLTFYDHATKIVSQVFVRENLNYKCFLSEDVYTLNRAITTIH